MTDKPVILIDDDESLRSALSQSLTLAGFSVKSYGSPESALKLIHAEYEGIIITDLKMPHMDGLQVLDAVQQIDTDIPVVLITGHGDISIAVEAIQKGAYDFIEKPFRKNKFIDVINHAVEKRRLIIENRKLKNQLIASTNLVLIGDSEPMLRLKQKIIALAEADVDVLIKGETGTGKELVARELHRNSPRQSGPFVPVNCAAIADSLVESELFGHEAGSFTGAIKKRIGKFENANSGTIFLDEIESIPLSLAVKILRILQERVVERIGSNKQITLDIKILAATKTDLKKLSEKGKFRDDLYYRLSVIELNLPPLRERKGDILILFYHFVKQAETNFNIQTTKPSTKFLKKLQKMRWPGNVRELKNMADRFVLESQFTDSQTDDPQIEIQPLLSHLDKSLGENISMFERLLIQQELEKHHGNIMATCNALGITRKTLYQKLKKHQIDHHSFKL